MRVTKKWIGGAAAMAFFVAQSNAQLAWGEEGLTGQIRVTFTEAATRSCLKAQIDAAPNKGIPVATLYEYCKCYSSTMANKMSDDEVRSLEATGSEQKYAEALHTRAEVATKQCQDEIRKTLLKSK